MKQKTITQYHNIYASASPYAGLFHKLSSPRKTSTYLTLLNSFITNPFISNQLKNRHQPVTHNKKSKFKTQKQDKTETNYHIYPINQLTH